MEEFEKYLEEELYKREKYICVVYDNNTQRLLNDWCEANGITHDKSYSGKNRYGPFKFHTTIFYSSTKHDLQNRDIPTTGTVTVKGLELMGEENDILTLKVDSPDIQKIRSQYEGIGMKDTWPEYKPHVSLSYDRIKNPKKLQSLIKPMFDLKFDTIQISDIDDS